MNNWQKVRLGDVVIFNPKESLKKGAISKKIAMDCLAPYCREISSFELAEFSGGTKFRNGDTIMARITPCLENGKTALVSVLDENEVGFGSTEYIVFREKQGITSSKFIYYFITNPSFRDVAIQSMVGSSGRQRVQQDVLENLEMELPPLAEQERIAGILGALDDKIELNNRINRNLEEQALGLFRRWFVDFEFPDANGKPYRTSGGEMTDSPLGEIPRGWRIGSIYEIADVIYGAPYKSKLFNDKKAGLPLIRIRDLKTNSPQFFTTEILPNTEYINMGDIVAGMDAEFIPYIWQGNIGLLNQRVCKFKHNKDHVSNLFVYFIIKPHLEFIQFHKVGTTVSHMGKSDIDRIEIAIPSTEVLRKYTEYSTSILQEILNLSKQNQNLADLRNSLLPKLMNNVNKIYALYRSKL